MVCSIILITYVSGGTEEYAPCAVAKSLQDDFRKVSGSALVTNSRGIAKPVSLIDTLFVS